MPIRILFVDDDPISREIFTGSIQDDSMRVTTAVDGLDALKKLEGFSADIVIIDLKMPGMDGLALLDEIRIRYPDIFVIVVTNSGSIESAVTAMKSGAYDYLLKPLMPETIYDAIDRISGQSRVSDPGGDTGKEKRTDYRFENIVGVSSKMKEIFRRIIDVAPTDATVLITGETGTGKDLIASAIHQRSLRKNGPFVRVNCAALPETLSNSELFGHEKGAFTGAVGLKKGYFEVADNGTIFLDEIGDVPLSTQVSLLHCIENRCFDRVGGTRTIRVDTRIICATNKPLPEMVEKQEFREDLFYRINVVSIALPPLRERRSDIPLLSDYFLKKYCFESKKNISGISSQAMKVLTGYDWPGNVRELSNTMERAVIFCKGNKIVPSDLIHILDATQGKEVNITLDSWSLPGAEENIIRKALSETNGNLKLAAEKLAIARGTLYSKMKKYNIENPRGQGE